MNCLPAHCYVAALKSRGCKICNLVAAFWPRCRPNHDLPHPVISLLLLRTLEHPCSPNRLVTTRYSFQNPLSVHFSSRRQARLSINIQYTLELPFNDIRMYMDHRPSQHPGTGGFSVGSPQKAVGDPGILPPYSRIRHLVGSATTLWGA
jgi:hypothetical protein